MATMNVSLPDPIKDWAEAQAKTGRYSNASDYVLDLIRRDQARNDKIAAMQSFVDKASKVVLAFGRKTSSLRWLWLVPAVMNFSLSVKAEEDCHCDCRASSPHFRVRASKAIPR